MATDDMNRDALSDELIDDELCNLFAAFDEVRASDELQEATLSRILAAAEPVADTTPITTSPSDGSPEQVASSTSPSLRSQTTAAERSESFEARAVAGGKSTRDARRAKWRAIRVAALAACLALALTGGVAYAVPASYYDVVQDDSTITLGVNVFGVTVSATSNGEEGEKLIASTELRNMPYEESLARAIEAMEARNPEAPVEFGPQGAEREAVQPRGEPGGREGLGGAQPNGGEERPDDTGQPNGSGQPGEADQPKGEGQPGGDGEPPSEGASYGSLQNFGGGAGEGGAPQQDPPPGNGQSNPSRER